jgi:hypothetical protein
VKINFFSIRLLLVLNVCCIFAAETPTGKTSEDKVRQEMRDEAIVRKLLDDHPSLRVHFSGIQQVKITQEMIHGSDIAGKLSEEFRKKNTPSCAKAMADTAENKQSSSDEEICSLRIAFKW